AARGDIESDFRLTELELSAMETFRCIMYCHPSLSRSDGNGSKLGTTGMSSKEVAPPKIARSGFDDWVTEAHAKNVGACTLSRCRSTDLQFYLLHCEPSILGTGADR